MTIRFFMPLLSTKKELYCLPPHRRSPLNKRGIACGKLRSYRFHNDLSSVRLSDSFTKSAMQLIVFPEVPAYILKGATAGVSCFARLVSVVALMPSMLQKLHTLSFHFDILVGPLFSKWKPVQPFNFVRVPALLKKLSTKLTLHTVKRSLKFTFLKAGLPLLKGSLN